MMSLQGTQAIKDAISRSAWRPINEAPINGADVLLWTESGQLVGYTYDRRKWYACGVKASHEDCDVELYEPPTHWMPIPPDPAGSASTLE